MTPRSDRIESVGKGRHPLVDLPDDPHAHPPSGSGSVAPFLIVSAVLVVAATALGVEFLLFVFRQFTSWQQASAINRASFELWGVVGVASAALSVRLMLARPADVGARWLMVALAGAALYAAQTVDGNEVRQWQWPRALAAQLAPGGTESLAGVLIGRVSLWLFVVSVLATIFALLMFSLRFPKAMDQDVLRQPLLGRLLSAALAWPRPPGGAGPGAVDKPTWVARFSGVLLLAWVAAAATLPTAVGVVTSLAGLAAAATVVRRDDRDGMWPSGIAWWSLAGACALLSLGWLWRAAFGSDSIFVATVRTLALGGVTAGFAASLRRLLAWRVWWPLAIGGLVAPVMVGAAGFSATRVQSSQAALSLVAPWALGCLGVAAINLLQTFFLGDTETRRRVRIVLVSLAAAFGLLVVYGTAFFYQSTACGLPIEGGVCLAVQRVWVFSQSLTVLVVVMGAAVAVLARGDIDPHLRWTRATFVGLSGVFLFVAFVVVEYVIEETLGEHLPSWSPGVLASLAAAGLVHVLKHPFEAAVARVIQAGEGVPVSGADETSGRDRMLARLAFAMVALVGVLYARELFAGRDDVEPLSAVIARTQRSVYLLVLKQGSSERALATAWVYSDRVLATNAHVAEEVRNALESRGAATVVARRSHGGFDDVPIEGVVMHPAYAAYTRTWFRLTPSQRDGDGRLTRIGYAPAYDVALLTVPDGTSLDPPLPRADQAALAALAPQTPLVYVGFPSEGLLEQNLHKPAPISQQGFLSAFETPTRTRVTGPTGATVLVHSIPATGGASGSPILDGRGRVVGLVSAVNTIVQGTGARAPNAVQLNYGQLVDLLDGVTTTTDGDVAALRGRWARELSTAFVVLPDAGDAFLEDRVRGLLTLDPKAATSDARIFTRSVTIPPADGASAHGRTSVVLEFSGRGPFVVAALDTSRDVDLELELQTERGWTPLGRDDLVSGVACVTLKSGVTGTVRATVIDADDRSRDEAPAGPVRLDVYLQPQPTAR